MGTGSRDGGPGPRLNPFAFPSDTDLRFALLIVSVLGSTMFVYGWLSTLTPRARAAALDVAKCLALYPPADSTLLRPEAGPAIRAATACQVPYWLGQAAWSLSGVLLVLLVGGLVYWLAPAGIVRWYRLTPLTADDAPELLDEVRALAAEAGLRAAPTIVTAAGRRSTSGFVFGHAARRYLALDGGLVMQHYTDPPAFRAVVRHELAHLRNADVDKAFLTVAVGVGFGVAALLPFLVSLVWQPLGDMLGIGWRGIALAGLVYLMAAAVLRARELYADARASAWDGPDGALCRVVGDLHEQDGRWTLLRALHPTAAARRELLDDTRSLFRLGFWEPFAAGFAAMVAFPMVVRVTGWLALGTHDSLAAPTIAGLMFAPLLVGVAGSLVWRGTFAALARGETLPSVWPPTLGLTLGLLAGQLLGLEAAISLSLVEAPAWLALYRLAWGILVLACVYGILHWIQSTASVWLEVAADQASPRAAYLASLASATLVLTLCFGILFATDGLVSGDGDLASFVVFGGAITYLYVMDGLLLVPALVSLWAYPFAALVRGRDARPVSTARWAYLESVTPASNSTGGATRLAGLRPRPAFLYGVVGALVYALLLVGVRLAVRAMVPEATRDADAFRLAFAQSMFGVGALLTVAIAAVAAARFRPFGAVHGLFAASAAGALMTAAFLVVNVGFGGTADLSFARTIFGYVGSLGMLLALPIVAVVSPATSRLAQRRPPEHAPPPAMPASA